MANPQLHHHEAIETLTETLEQVKRLFPDYPKAPAEWSAAQWDAFVAFEAAGKAVIETAAKLPDLK